MTKKEKRAVNVKKKKLNFFIRFIMMVIKPDI